MFRCNYHNQGAHYLSLLKLQCLNSQLKYNDVVNLVVWLAAYVIRSLLVCVCSTVRNLPSVGNKTLKISRCTVEL
jgi:hypothetical protein